MRRLFQKWSLIFLAGILISSCVPVKRISYVQSKDNLTDSEVEKLYFVGVPQDNLIRPGDELYIRISSADENPTNLTEGRQYFADPSLLSHTVDPEGTIKLPYIGRFHITDLTLGQASDSIENALSQYLYYPAVFIKFVNNKITVLGDVNRPGVYLFNYKNVNILQALGYANDIGTYGNRKRVLLIREEGVVKTKHYLDVTNDKLFESPWYLLKSNDIIYVEPLKRKKWDMNTVPYNLILSVISTGIVILTFINTKP
ncbi:MAG TPA: polysaccharide biosynthesis/export family protein [Bacteroidales bacterium]|nr:polysaccharide biosynthesis/export family protein [Bacteroidales bacterium]